MRRSHRDGGRFLSDDLDITRLLGMLEDPDSNTAEVSERLYSALYPHLHRLAFKIMRHERPDHTLQPTALVSEAYLRLIDQRHGSWESRSHFLAVSARIMRRILTDHARARRRLKRGGELVRVTLHDDLRVSEVDLDELLTLDRALERLNELSERISRVVELRVFGGMTVREVAHVLGVSIRTANNDWSFARRWLAVQMSASDGASE